MDQQLLHALIFSLYEQDIPEWLFRVCPTVCSVGQGVQTGYLWPTKVHYEALTPSVIYLKAGILEVIRFR